MIGVFEGGWRSGCEEMVSDRKCASSLHTVVPRRLNERLEFCYSDGSVSH